MVFSNNNILLGDFSVSGEMLGLMVFLGIILVLISILYDIKRGEISKRGIYKWFLRNFSWSERLRHILGFEKFVWDNLSLSEKRIINDLYFRCKSNKVKLIFSKGNKIDYCSSEVSGYFDDGNGVKQPELGVATGKHKEDWILVLLHESSHMDQWLENRPHWIMGRYKGKDVYDLLEEWISGKDMPEHDIDWIIGCCINIELECEKLTLLKLKHYKIHWISQSEYIQRSNSYLAYFGAIRVFRRWYEVAPYEHQVIWEKMPRIFLNKDKYLNLDEQYLEIYRKHCFKLK